MGTRHVIVLAAGKGTRMGSHRPKVLHRLSGQALITHVLRAARTLDPASITVIVGHQADRVRKSLATHDDLQFIHQEAQLGTGHALLQAESMFSGMTGNLVVLSGDVPRISRKTLRSLISAHESSNAVATVLTATLKQPFGYGRIVRHNGAFVATVEESDATTTQRAIHEINTGIYVFQLGPLFPALHQIPKMGPKHELYLPALLSKYHQNGLKVETISTEDENEIRGINSQNELAEVSIMMRNSKNEELMAAGVTIEDPQTTYIGVDVSVGADTVIHPGVTLEGKTSIGARCELHSGIRIVDSVVSDDVTINNFCVIRDARIERGGQIGPFAHLRPGSTVGDAARVGNFVELKKTSVGSGSKVNHLTYLGDTNVGEGVNIGAGTITCNYDGQSKHETTIENDVFVGSGTQLVAPVTVGHEAYIAAGSCITDDVPSGSLAISRGQQQNKKGWATKKKSGNHDD